MCKLTMCIQVVYMLSVCVARPSRRYTHSSNLGQDCRPAGAAVLSWAALEGGIAHKVRKEETYFLSFVFVSVCVEKGSKVFVLPGKVVLTLKLDRHVNSSSPPEQSLFPSQALSIGINFTDLLQKKYLLSISCLTKGKRRGTLEKKGVAQVRHHFAWMI